MEAPDYSRIWECCFSGHAGMQQYQQPDTARRYDASRTIWEDGYDRAEKFNFSADSSVLDIGCGPGVLSIPLAKRVKSVTVVEPSLPMLDILTSHCEELGISNIRQFNSTWEDVVLPDGSLFDYVIASYSLGMPDIRKAIEKMNRYAVKKVYLFWFSGVTTWEKISNDLMPLVWGRSPEYKPKADIIYGVLCQIGIPADITHLSGTGFDKSFNDRNEAIKDLRTRLGVDDDQFDCLFERYLDESGVYVPENGLWRYRDRTNYVCISWDVPEKED